MEYQDFITIAKKVENKKYHLTFTHGVINLSRSTHTQDIPILRYYTHDKIIYVCQHSKFIWDAQSDFKMCQKLCRLIKEVDK